MKEFREYLDKLIALGRALTLFSWDMTAGGAPKGGISSRAKSIGILSSQFFEMRVSQEMQNFLEELGSKEDELDPITKGMYREAKKDFMKIKNIPVDEYREYAELCAVSEAKWEEAKEKSDFEMFKPYLEKVVDFKRRFAKYRGGEYDILLDDYEPGMDTNKLDEFFAELKATIVPLLKAVTNSKKKIRTDFLSRQVPVSVQKELSDYLLKMVGFDFNRGMIRESEHPFTTGLCQNDVRITTHYYENAFLSSLYSTMHEFGHANYELHISKDLLDTIIESGVSMGIHESQSRFYENVVGRGLSFWESIYDDFIRITGDIFKDVTAKELFEASNIAKPSLIRIESDELTYSLHIMVRYEIEKLLFSNKVEAADLPKLWNEKMSEYLGVTPENDKTGVLQDVHWSDGMFGYFPSYALGNAYASQITHFMKKDFEAEGVEFDDLIKNKDYAKINAWLEEKIHKFGMNITPGEIINGIAGEDFSAKYYTEYLKDKYTKLYEI